MVGMFAGASASEVVFASAGPVAVAAGSKAFHMNSLQSILWDKMKMHLYL